MSRSYYHEIVGCTRRYYAALVLLIICLTAWQVQAKPAWQISKSDMKIAERADWLAARERWKEAVEKADQAREPLIGSIFRWRKYIAGSKYTTFENISAFAKQHPHWPREEKMRQRVEEAVTATTPNEEILDWFRVESSAGHYVFKDPVTAKGRHVLAKAMLAEQAKVNARLEDITRLFREAWIEINFTSRNERSFYDNYKQFLRQEDHIARTNRLIWDNRLSEAKRMFSRIPSGYQRLFDARITLRTSRYGVDRAIRRVPKMLARDDGLIYDRIVWRERHKVTDNMPALLKAIPQQRSNPRRFWRLLEKYIHALRKEGEYDLAYQLASHHNFDGDLAGMAEAEWYAGWIALRFQNEPRKAYKHFYAMYQKVQTPISRGRAAYWAGRAAEANNNPQIASKWYQEAAKYPTSFYGQLATEKIGRTTLVLPQPPNTTAADMARFKKNDLVKSSFILGKLGEHALARLFVSTAAEHARDTGQQILITQFGLRVNRPDYSIMAAKKAARNNGPILVKSMYPELNLLKDIRGQEISQPESAFIHAIIRQESMFNQYARSHAGARGLMQLMPATAREVARKLNLRYSKSRLTSNPVYNITLGSYYLNERVEQFDGSYLLASASYNAGQGNVRKWLAEHGDPRQLKTMEDKIDWIESIPFSETRNYVMRILENLQLYRYALGVHNEPLVLISQDINR